MGVTKSGAFSSLAVGNIAFNLGRARGLESKIFILGKYRILTVYAFLNIEA
jgi:hypothetical protein